MNGQLWIRVFGPNLQPQHKERMKKNDKVLASGKFLDACGNVGIKPTGRQASKFRREAGAAQEFHTRCHDCGQFLKKERWVRKDHPRKAHGLCADCYSLYDSFWD